MPDNKHTNRLINESSPYLLQHAHNPVDWHPWGDEALEKAKREDKLLIISIGYSACHWCHVMEHETFEDDEAASLMNRRFVAIKVDREERPDIDTVYMNAVQLINGSGGWPLNVIALPDGRPLFGGTYFRKEQWLNLLEQVSDYYLNNREKTLVHAAALTEGIRSGEVLKLNTEKPVFDKTLIDELAERIIDMCDTSYGGFRGAPKFPLPSAWKFLLHHYGMHGSRNALDAVVITLDRIAYGGIHDQLGGGFSRYSTDEKWHIPHFEKMLYDNAQLLSLYSLAFRVTGKELYRKVVYGISGFIENELRSPEGMYYSSLDADSEGEEGKYYAWSSEEVKRILGDSSECFSDYFGITEKGNWENELNILYTPFEKEDFAFRRNIQVSELDDLLAESSVKILAERCKRTLPGLDNKIITSWNALIIIGYTDAFRVFGEERFLEKAINCAGMLIGNLRKADGGLYRCFTGGRSSVNGFLDDYAGTIDAFTALYQATFNEKWIEEAEILTQYAVKHFSDPVSGMFFYTSDEDPPLAARTYETADNVIPSSNSVMAINLFNLGRLTGNDDYVSMSRRMAGNILGDARRGGPYYSNWDILLTMLSDPPAEVVIMGRGWEERMSEFNKIFLPGVLFAGGSSAGRLPLLQNRLKEGSTMIYVCKNKSCRLPVETIPESLVLLGVKR